MKQRKPLEYIILTGLAYNLRSSDANGDQDSITFNLAVTGDWNGHGRIDFSAPNGSSTGPFREVNSFSFVATSSFGTTEFAAVDLAFAYWSVGPSGLMSSFSILTNPVKGFYFRYNLVRTQRSWKGKSSLRLKLAH